MLGDNRITYRTLAALINLMSEEQKDCDLTVEIAGDNDDNDNDCYGASLRIAGTNNDCLDEGHPVIYLDKIRDMNDRTDDLEVLAKLVGI